MLELPVGRYVMYLRKSRADEERERNGEFETLGKHERELSAMCRRMAVPVEMPPLRELVSRDSRSLWRWCRLASLRASWCTPWTGSGAVT